MFRIVIVAISLRSSGALAGSAALLGYDLRLASAEAPPSETTKHALQSENPVTFLAPQYGALAKGFVSMKFVLRVLAVAAAMTAPVAYAVPFKLLVDDGFATQPAINDLGEVVYAKPGGSVISTTRGLLIGGGVDAGNLGLSNSGEVVFADGGPSSQVTSTTRGVLVSSRSLAPTISATTGEVGYINGEGFQGIHFFTTAQGQVETFDPSAGYQVGVGDVNDLGEVVFELNTPSCATARIYSTVRGYLTPCGVVVRQPAINDLGEVVYSGDDSGLRQQIFSTDRGQLTFFEGPKSVLTADLPDIDNEGHVVFRGVVDGVGGLYVTLPANRHVPEPGTLAFLGIAIAGIGLARRYKCTASH